MSPPELCKPALIKYCFKIDVYELFLPENTLNDKTKHVIKTLISDISVKIEHSLAQINKKYL